MLPIIPRITTTIKIRLSLLGVGSEDAGEVGLGPEEEDVVDGAMKRCVRGKESIPMKVADVCGPGYLVLCRNGV